jgi:hypothetical protein
VILNKDAKNMLWPALEKYVVLENLAVTGTPTCRRLKPDPYFSFCTKQLKLNQRPKGRY